MTTVLRGIAIGVLITVPIIALGMLAAALGVDDGAIGLVLLVLGLNAAGIVSSWWDVPRGH